MAQIMCEPTTSDYYHGTSAALRWEEIFYEEVCFQCGYTPPRIKTPPQPATLAGTIAHLKAMEQRRIPNLPFALRDSHRLDDLLGK